MIVDITEEELYELIKIHINKSNTGKIEKYVNMIDINNYPNLWILLGIYYKKIMQIDKMFYYLNKGLEHDKIMERVLLEISEYYIKNNQIDKYNKIIEAYQPSKNFFIFLGSFIESYNPGLALILYNKYQDYISLTLAQKLCKKIQKWGQYIMYSLILSKKYNDTMSLIVIQGIIHDLCYKKYRKRLDTFNIFKSEFRKCNFCKESYDLILTLKCNHSVCQECCYKNFDIDTCNIICACGYKSLSLFNKIIKYLNVKYSNTS